MFWNAPPPYPIPASSDFLASAVLDPTRTTGEFDNLCQEYIYSTAPPLTVTSSLTGSTVPSSPSEAAQTYAGLDDVTVAPGLDMEDMSEEGEWERKDSTPVAQRAQRRSFSVVDCRGRSPGQHVAMALRRPQPYRPLHHLLAGAPHGPKCDPVGRRPSHPFDAAKHQGRITYYCVHEDGRKCRMDAPFRKKKSVFDEHLRSISHDHRFRCPHCDHGFNRTYNLKRHYKTCPALLEDARHWGRRFGSHHA